jgi:orotidine-5'-phosphate decarboxylase
MAGSDPKDRLIVALDLDTLHAAGVEAVQKRGGEVFLDLKYHDIPNTVAGAAREAARMGVFMFNVHASGGRAMMHAAAEAATAAAKEFAVRRPLVIAVTVLTSLDRAALSAELGLTCSVEGHVLHLCQLARGAGLDGSVASPNEIHAVRNNLGSGWIIVTPGVRPAGSEPQDQARIATPRDAARAGARYLVVGRPITAAADPVAATESILKELRA